MAGSGTNHLRRDGETLLSVRDLNVTFPSARGTVQAVSNISLDIREGETLGLVGESGSGKSTLGRAILQLVRPTSGTVTFDGQELTSLDREALRRIRPNMQPIFQDPISSLNPRRRVRDIVAEPLDVWRRDDREHRQAAVDEALAAVGLDPDRDGDRRPHEFSGGQCQRISIARALVMRPKLLVCDEPVSALDVSIQAQILNLLLDLKEQYQLTVLFIAHDLAVVKQVSDRVMVMYLGKLCEVGGPDELYTTPAHPYTAALLSCVPVPDVSVAPSPAPLRGEIPSPVTPPSGCRFRTRCPTAYGRCAESEPVMEQVSNQHHVACHVPMTGH